jgi:hypothetical protein
MANATLLFDFSAKSFDIVNVYAKKLLLSWVVFFLFRTFANRKYTTVNIIKEQQHS